jgi:hypothetical protein
VLNFIKKIRFWFDLIWSYFGKVIQELRKTEKGKEKKKRNKRATGQRFGPSQKTAHGPSSPCPN